MYCTLAVSHCPLMVVVGLRVPTPAMGGTVGTSCELLARALGVSVAPAHRTCLVHRCPGLSKNAPLLCVCVCSTTTHSLLKGHVGSDYSQTQSMCVENLCCSVTISPSLPPSFLSINSFSPSLYLLSRRRGSMTEVFYELPPKQPKFVAKCKLYHKPYRFTMTSKLTRLNDVHPIEFWALKTKHSCLSTVAELYGIESIV